MAENKKLLLLTNEVPNYRIPVYNHLALKYELTVAHFGKLVEDNELNFKQLILNRYNIGSLVIFKESIYKIAKNFDIVLANGDLHIIPYMLLGLRLNRKFSLTYWGGDVSFSYNKHYDEDRRFDKVRFFLMNRADSLVFYCSYPINRYVVDGRINRNKLFVAPNTVSINNKISIPPIKKHFLFVGTLYKAKKIYELLYAYLESFKLNKDLQQLIIIGDGDESENIKIWIKNNFLTNKIILKGAIYENILLELIFSEAICCISPGQAGLSVLSSLAYGVPFVTSKNALTGGEIFNIIDNYNGILYDGSVMELSKIINQLSVNQTKVYELSNNAQNYYFENTTINHMVAGLCDSIEYAHEKFKC
jgi:hypothetical protein